MSLPAFLLVVAVLVVVCWAVPRLLDWLLHEPPCPHQDAHGDVIRFPRRDQ